MIKNTTKTLSDEEFMAWPGWQVFKTTGTLSVLFLFIFYAVYGLTDYLTHSHDYRIPIHFNWELKMPLVTSMSLVYISISPLLMLAPFVIRDIVSFKLMFKVLVIELLIAAVFFMLLPVAKVYPDVLANGPFVWVLNLADSLNLTHNEIPSLHVAFAFTVAYFYTRKRRLLGKILLWGWAFLLAVSTLLTHQHYVLSVMAGMLLSALVIYFMVIKQQKKF